MALQRNAAGRAAAVGSVIVAFRPVQQVSKILPRAFMNGAVVRKVRQELPEKGSETAL
jgi:hypothetical protein